MNEKNIIRAVNKARTLRNNLNDENIIGIDFKKLIDYIEKNDNIKIEVRKIDFNKVDFLEETASGLVVKNDNKLLIYIEKYETMERQRFTILHEISHYVLGHISKADSFVDYKKDLNYSFQTKIPEDKEAYVFAAELLMPKEQVYGLHKITQNTDELAKVFQVAVADMDLRFKMLGLREW